MGLKLIPLLFCLTFAQAQTPPEASKLVTLNKVEIHGSRLQEDGLTRLLGLAVGEQVNDMTVNKACHRVTVTGLVKKIDYAYDVYPDKPGVTLVLTMVDEAPLIPARITPEADEAPLWQALESSNPLLTHELPRTEAALKFYATEIESVLRRQGRNDEYVAPLVVGDANGSAAGIVFAIRSFKQLNLKTK